jgi:sigma-B regulation protein RsbU (phosphoserine phosphatase)
MKSPASFEDKYDRLLYSLRSLADMGETISGVRSVAKASNEILHIVLGTMGVSKGALLTLEGGRLTVSAARGAECGKHHRASEEMLVELERTDTNLLARWSDEFPAELKAFCDKSFSGFKVVIASILRAQNKMIGLLLLSKRFMSQEYTAEDLQLLDMICRHVSVALFNFDLRKRIQAVNFQLSHKVLQMESLHDIGLSVASFKPKKEMLHEVLFGSMSLLDAQKAFYLEIDGGKLAVGSRVGVTEEQLSSFIGNSTYTRKLLAGKTLMHRSSRVSKKIFGSETLLAVPVGTSKRLFGTLAVLGKETVRKHPSFSRDDRKLLEAFATQAAVALENAEMQQAIIEQERIKQELETAADIHRLIVPSPADLPVIEDFSIYGHNYPCKEVGGDYFDIIPISDEKFGLVICDVSGKGLSAALLVSTLQATFHSLFQSHMNLVEIAHKANKILLFNTTSDKYASGFMAIVHVKDGCIESINAGHNEPLVLRSSGAVEKLSTGGFCLGMFDFTTYSSQTTKLSPGDTVYLYTDGISEAFSPDGAEFGIDRLEEFVTTKAGASPKRLLLEVEQRIREWTNQNMPGEGFAHDDFTQLAIQMK